MEYLSRLIKDIIVAFYQPFLFSGVLTFFSLYFYLYAYEPQQAGNGWKESIILGIRKIVKDKSCQSYCLQNFYYSLLSFRTLFNRNICINPLSDVIGTWNLVSKNVNTGIIELSFDPLENLFLFMPFAYLLLVNNRDIKMTSVVVKTFYASFTIEFLQLLLHVGTFQLSDIFYNSLGAIFICVWFKIKKLYAYLRWLNKN